MDKIAFALETIGSTTFERLAAAFLRIEGYEVHESSHSGADGGWDARVTTDEQQGIAHASVRDDWRQKIREDANKVSGLEDELEENYDIFVFVTNQDVKGVQEIEMEKEIQNEYGWDLNIYHRSNLIGEIQTNSPGLAEDFLDVTIKTDDDHLERLLDLRNKRIQQVRQRNADAAELEQGPAIALHVIPKGVSSQKGRSHSGKVPKPPC